MNILILNNEVIFCLCSEIENITSLRLEQSKFVLMVNMFIYISTKAAIHFCVDWAMVPDILTVAAFMMFLYAVFRVEMLTRMNGTDGVWFKPIHEIHMFTYTLYPTLGLLSVSLRSKIFDNHIVHPKLKKKYTRPYKLNSQLSIAARMQFLAKLSLFIIIERSVKYSLHRIERSTQC